MQTIAESNYGRSVSQTDTFNLTGTDFRQYAVVATAGVGKLEGEDSCSTSNAVGTAGLLSMGSVVFGTFALAVAL